VRIGGFLSSLLDWNVMKIAYLTAGAAGMFCGSCMHDNTLARALIRLGADVQLIPLYTPIKTDEENVSSDRIFFGGINVYLQQNVPLYRFLPRWIAKALDQKWLISWATKRSSSIRAETLGPLAVSMLRGKEGFQRAEVNRLVEWLAGDLRPDVIVLTNILIAGCAPEIKKRLKSKLVVTLQGDDIFLDGLTEPYQSQAIAEIRKISESIDGYISASKFYADFMANYLGLPRNQIAILPLGLDVEDFADFAPGQTLPKRPEERPPTIGYLARIAPEKGFHLLVDAFLKLRSRGRLDVRLEAAGWLGDHRREYYDEQLTKIREAGAIEQFRYWGAVSRTEKIEFLKSIDLFSVPTTYREPKGLFALEAMAAGVPVVLPNHGAFPEIISQTGGGKLFSPENSTDLSLELQRLLENPAERELLSEAGRTAVHTTRNSMAMGSAHLQFLKGLAN
jgi:glycosyltransferase involved in cell wall biosynthesis